MCEGEGSGDGPGLCVEPSVRPPSPADEHTVAVKKHEDIHLRANVIHCMNSYEGGGAAMNIIMNGGGDAMNIVMKGEGQL